MNTNIFDMNDIITITISMLDDLEKEKTHGIEDDSLNIPYYINLKLEELNDKDCEEFLSIVDDISREVHKLKSGELDELNIMHKEIINLASRKLNKYIY